MTLLNQSGEVVGSCRTGADGRYEFAPVSGGIYTVQFDAGSGVVFSDGALFQQCARMEVRGWAEPGAAHLGGRGLDDHGRADRLDRL